MTGLPLKLQSFLKSKSSWVYLRMWWSVLQLACLLTRWTWLSNYSNSIYRGKMVSHLPQILCEYCISWPYWKLGRLLNYNFLSKLSLVISVQDDCRWRTFPGLLCLKQIFFLFSIILFATSLETKCSFQKLNKWQHWKELRGIFQGTKLRIFYTDITRIQDGKVCHCINWQYHNLPYRVN